MRPRLLVAGGVSTLVPTHTRHLQATIPEKGAIMRSTSIISTVIGIVVLGSGAQAQDWPQWRGANRDAKASGFTAPKTWPKELTQKWKTAVGGGDASPAVVGDKVYVFA